VLKQFGDKQLREQPVSIIEQIDADLKTSMRAGDKFRTETLRNLKSAIKYAEIDGGASLTDQDVTAVVAQQAKQRRDSITEFEKANRTDLVDNEKAQLKILETYLPEQLSEADIKTKAEAVIAELGITNAREMGQVMKRMMADLKGQADGKIVNKVVRELLS
jgi:uncharacterized protein YqeY